MHATFIPAWITEKNSNVLLLKQLPRTTFSSIVYDAPCNPNQTPFKIYKSTIKTILLNEFETLSHVIGKFKIGKFNGLYIGNKKEW